MADRDDYIFYSMIVAYVLSVVLISAVGLGFVHVPSTTTYTYEVKAQQVFDTDRVEDSDVTEFEDLSEDEQRLLYDAFKKTDHFMGTSETTVRYNNERLDTFTDWRTIESNGVLLLVAVDESTSRMWDFDRFEWYHYLLPIALIIGVIGSAVLLLPIVMILTDPTP